MTTRIHPPILTRFALLGLVVPPLLAIASACFACQAAPPPYSVEILVDGHARPVYGARGTSYVEALEGREYSIRLRNNTGRRVAVALSVDGLSTIDAKTTAARHAPKWVLGPWETATVSGWQTGFDTARRFYFTTEEASYGAWLGRRENLGLISAAFFREVERPRPEPRRHAPVAPGPTRDGARQQNEAEAGSRMQAAPMAQGKVEADEYAATGIGREIDAPLRTIDVALEPSPAATINLRYEFRDALVRLGVLPDVKPLPDPLARRERARGFIEFAPDPYR